MRIEIEGKRKWLCDDDYLTKNNGDTTGEGGTEEKLIMQNISSVLNDNHLPGFVLYILHSQLFYKADLMTFIL